MTIEDVIPSEGLELEDEFVYAELQTQLQTEVLEITFTKVNFVTVLNVDEIQIENKIIYYQKEGNYYGYGLIDFEEVKIQLPFDSFEKNIP